MAARSRRRFRWRVKFRTLASTRLSDAALDEIISTVHNIETDRRCRSTHQSDHQAVSSDAQ
jgi:hypothetical protein